MLAARPSASVAIEVGKHVSLSGKRRFDCLDSSLIDRSLRQASFVSAGILSDLLHHRRLQSDNASSHQYPVTELSVSFLALHRHTILHIQRFLSSAYTATTSKTGGDSIEATLSLYDCTIVLSIARPCVLFANLLTGFPFLLVVQHSTGGICRAS